MNELRLPSRDYYKIRVLFDSDAAATEFISATADAVLDNAYRVTLEKEPKIFEAQATIAKAFAKQARRNVKCAMAAEEDLGDNDRQHDDDYNQRPNRTRAV